MIDQPSNAVLATAQLGGDKHSIRETLYKIISDTSRTKSQWTDLLVHFEKLRTIESLFYYIENPESIYFIPDYNDALAGDYPKDFKWTG